MEHTAQCRAYDDLRRAPGDWNAAHYTAWEAGRTHACSFVVEHTDTIVEIVATVFRGKKTQVNKSLINDFAKH